MLVSCRQASNSSHSVFCRQTSLPLLYHTARGFSKSPQRSFPRNTARSSVREGSEGPDDEDDRAIGTTAKRGVRPMLLNRSPGGGSQPSGKSGPSAPPLSLKQPPLPAAFAANYLSHPTPPPSDAPPSTQVLALRDQLLASFLPAIQTPLSTSSPEPVIAVVCPIEGGERLIRDLIQNAASLVGASVIRIEGIEGLGMGVWGSLDEAGSAINLSPNPLHVSSTNSESPDDDEDFYPVEFGQADNDGEGLGEETMEEAFARNRVESRSMVVALPVGMSIQSGMLPPGMGGPSGPFGKMGSRESLHLERSKAAEAKRRTTQLFKDIVTVGEGDATSGKRRIIYIQDATAMAETFDQWFPILREAVKARRREKPRMDGDSKADDDIESNPFKSLAPTTIILGCSPSIIHTGPHVGRKLAEANDARAKAGLRSHPSRTSVTDTSAFTHELWKGSEEDDTVGRQARLERRLRVAEPSTSSSRKHQRTWDGMYSDLGLRLLLPSFGGERPSTNESADSVPDHIKQIMSSMGVGIFGQNGSVTADQRNKGATEIWRVVAALPSGNDWEFTTERQQARRRINSLLLKKAVALHGGRLTDRSPSEELAEDSSAAASTEGGLTAYSSVFDALRNTIHSVILPWANIKNLATAAVGHSLSQHSTDSAAYPQEPTVTWKAVVAATIQNEQLDVQQKELLAGVLAGKSKGVRKSAPGGATAELEEQSVEPTVDPVVEALKKDTTLSTHEQRLLGCIVDPNKLAAISFQDVHLPESTIDAVRSVVTLPMLYPEAFSSGILGQHSTNGCLLFGPPGTGKTLLARALAKESGARMLAIQPSDLGDMFVGESEKLVRAVFKLARRLSPCIVFLDEVDSLFGARSGRGVGGGAQVYRQVLTEFMQEMDGLTSAIANKEKQLIVMGATNRPFDLDDAVLRRLPRRLLVDLPGVKDREAILKILLKKEVLADDVNLGKLAQQTEGYSGSDLKHLCVSAALAALKESVIIPWKPAKSAVSPPHLPASSPLPTSELPRIALPWNPTVPEEPSEQLSPIETIAGTTTLVNSLQSTKVTEGSAEVDLALGLTETEATATTNSAEVGSMQRNSKVDKSTVDQEPAVTKPGATATRIPPRKLTAAHFEIAMKEITPSSSEEGNLPELRKWAEQYGEGGTKRGKKLGYGGKFGFGDAQTAGVEEEAAYGRVRPEGKP